MNDLELVWLNGFIQRIASGLLAAIVVGCIAVSIWRGWRQL